MYVGRIGQQVVSGLVLIDHRNGQVSNTKMERLRDRQSQMFRSLLSKLLKLVERKEI